jgi:hypothetical protein
MRSTDFTDDTDVGSEWSTDFTDDTDVGSEWSTDFTDGTDVRRGRSTDFTDGTDVGSERSTDFTDDTDYCVWTGGGRDGCIRRVVYFGPSVKSVKSVEDSLPS